MLIYEHKRTEEFIDHLLFISGRIRLYIMIFYLASFAVTGFAIGAAIDHNDLAAAIIGTVLGGGLGWFAGTLTNMIVLAVVEWMAQILIAQGEMVRLLASVKTSSD